MNAETTYTAFLDNRMVAHGTLGELVRKIKAGPAADFSPLIFDDSTGEQVDFDLRGSAEEIMARTGAAGPRGPGRPKLGVTSREVTLLPRHWEWLDRQPQSASATIRRLIDAARKAEPAEADIRRRIEAAGRFIWAIAGNFVNFEEASRALYGRDWGRLRRLIEEWPHDVRDHLIDLVGEIGEN